MSEIETAISLIVEVAGVPAPQGSKNYVGHRRGKPVLIESSAGVAPWRDAVAWAARSAINRSGWTRFCGPVGVRMTFYLPRPRSAPHRRTWPDRQPDLDKLVRSTLDALVTAGAIEDDARVVRVEASKLYAAGRVGADIAITPIADVVH